MKDEQLQALPHIVMVLRHGPDAAAEQNVGMGKLDEISKIESVTPCGPFRTHKPDPSLLEEEFAHEARRYSAKAGFSIELTLPSDRFNRKVGIWAGQAVGTHGRAAAAEEIGDALPNERDRIYVKSLMVPVREIGKCANWIAPPDRGINNNNFDFEYVRAA